MTTKRVLIAAFQQEVGSFKFGLFLLLWLKESCIQQCVAIDVRRVYIRSCYDKQLGELLATNGRRPMQRCPSGFIFRIYIRASSQMLFNGFVVSQRSCFVN